MINSGNNFSNDGKIINSKVKVIQNQDFRNKHIEFKKDELSTNTIDYKRVSKRVRNFYINLLIELLAITANLIGLFSYFKLSKIFIFIVIFIYLFILFLKYGTDLWIHRNSETLKTTALYKDGFFYKNKNSDYVEYYQKSAKCIYPKCNGTVYIQPAPEREKEKFHELVGVCDVGKHLHTYTCDNNGIGFPKEFDWRPIEENSKAEK